MEKFKTIFHRLVGGVYIPDLLLNRDEEIILHISDTPDSFFSVLNRIIKKIKPEYIVHTGDLVDNIKLQISPNLLPIYEKKLKNIVGMLSNPHCNKVYICKGNHDNFNSIKYNYSNICFIEDSSIIRIKDIPLKISHYPDKILSRPCDYNLFGHDLSLNSGIYDNKIYLNGIESINIIYLNSKRVFKLPYPYGINDSRLGRGKVGL